MQLLRQVDHADRVRVWRLQRSILKHSCQHSLNLQVREVAFGKIVEFLLAESRAEEVFNSDCVQHSGFDCVVHVGQQISQLGLVGPLPIRVFNLRGVAFADGGLIWNDDRPLEWKALRTAVQPHNGYAKGIGG